MEGQQGKSIKGKVEESTIVEGSDGLEIVQGKKMREIDVKNLVEYLKQIGELQCIFRKGKDYLLLEKVEYFMQMCLY